MRHPSPKAICRVLATFVLISAASVSRPAIWADPTAATTPEARPKANLDEALVPAYTLPDPLACLDGSKVINQATWEKRRRAELLALFSSEVYGRTPVSRLPQLHWAVTSVDPAALGGKAVRKEITVWFTGKDDGPQMHLLVYQPASPGRHAPWPLFLGLNYVGNESVAADPGITLPTAEMRDSASAHIVNHHVTDASRGVQASQWQVDKIIAHGYAVATLYYGDICPDVNEAALSGGVGALFRDGNGPRQSGEWGAIGEWAWGLSRALDYIETDAELDPRRVAVLGHSRLGKAALWAGAQDQRFAMVISNESGCEGAKIGRRVYGQVPTDISIAFPYWFCPKFSTYRHHDDQIPVDQNELLSLVAPRLLYVASAEGDRNSDPKGEFLGLKAAEPVYALYSKSGLPVASQPAVNTPVSSDTLGYHVRTGKHDITEYDWDQYIAFADKYLKP